MRKRILFLWTLLITGCCPLFAADFTPSELLSAINLKPGETTRKNVTDLLGEPARVEENKHKTLWYYTHGNTEMVVSFSNKSATLNKFSFKLVDAPRKALDAQLPMMLKSGATEICEALKLLGTPRDALIRERTQEMHYAYDQKVLRLFFRDRVLVDYCLY